MKTALLDLQGAIFQRLSTDVALKSIITAVYDDVDASAQYPYVTLGEDMTEPFNTKTSLGETINTTLHCWSSYSGKAEAIRILNLMLQALSNTPLPIGGGFLLVADKLVRMRVFNDVSFGIYHGIMTLEFRINN